MKCEVCGDEHELLDPTFRRPDDVFAMSDTDRALRVKEDDDLCVIRAETFGDDIRCFVRCTLAVELLDSPEHTRWGVWAEVSPDDFQTILERWQDPDQDREPPMPATLANRIPGYPDTRGLPLRLRLTDLASRPAVELAPDTDHPFATECRGGVSVHRVMQWLDSTRPPP